MVQKTIITKDTPPDVIEKDIAITRKEMSETIDEIEERFSLEHWKAATTETINNAASRGKELANRARGSALRFGRAARDRSLNTKNSALRFIKDNPSAARIMAFELGAWIVIAARLMNRKRATQTSRGSGRTDYAKAKITSIEEVEQKVKKAATTPEEGFKKAA
jgi:hypothetical protein